MKRCGASDWPALSLAPLALRPLKGAPPTALAPCSRLRELGQPRDLRIHMTRRSIFSSLTEIGEEPFSPRVAMLRSLALSVADRPMFGAHVDMAAEQADHVELLRLAEQTPELAIAKGWSRIADTLAHVCKSLGLPDMRNPLKQLNSLEKHKMLSFDEYALLRDLYTLGTEAQRLPAGRVTSDNVVDYVVAVRKASRLLLSVAARGARPWNQS